MALRAFDAVDGRGLARVDFFLTADGPVVNELNTMPGFTPISMFPKVWIAGGMTYGELITDLVETALART
jgi:D-alanine-D-alanine ligase